jgi:chorismate mutase/prephenate dehydratase
MSLNVLRLEIDGIDREIVRLLNKRAAVAIRIGSEKKKQNLPVRDPRREKAVLAKVGKRSKGPLAGAQVEKIYKQIITACVNTEMAMKIEKIKM